MNSEEFQTMRAVFLVRRGSRAGHPLGGNALDTVMETRWLLDATSKTTSTTKGRSPDKPTPPVFQRSPRLALARLTSLLSQLF